MTRAWVAFSIGVVLLSAGDALARSSPYRLVAVYTDARHEQTLEVGVTDGAVLPERGSGLVLDRIKIHFELAGFGATATGTFRNFSVGALVDGVKQKPISVASKDITDSTSRDVVVWRSLASSARVTQVAVDVRGKFAADFLCSQELYLRHLHANRRQAGQDEKPRPAAAEPVADGQEAACRAIAQSRARPREVLRSAGGTEILFSFCKDEEGALDWATAARCPAYALDSARTGDELHGAHKNALSKLLVDEKILTRFMTPSAEIATGADAPELPSNTYVSEVVGFKVLRVGELLSFSEQSDVVQPLGNVLAKDSTLLIRANGGGIGACPDLFGYSYRFVVDSEDGKSTRDQLTVAYRNGCEVSVESDLDKYLGKQVRLEVVQSLGDDQELIVATTTFGVAQLGVVSTFPVVTEILTALDGKSTGDLTASSSLPLGVAIGRDGNVRLALTLPWKFSYNPRRAPELARYFAIFAHLTVLASGADDSLHTELGVGVGVSSFQFFHFAWAISLADNHRNYFLISLDIKDISKFVLAGLE
jgi:hypothetical protein